jgi:hypothetical protein
MKSSTAADDVEQLHLGWPELPPTIAAGCSGRGGPYCLRAAPGAGCGTSCGRRSGGCGAAASWRSWEVAMRRGIG